MPQLARPAARKAPTIRKRRRPVWPFVASSSAYFARNGGASAVTVARRSETTERAVRPRYAAASDHSVASRRRVRLHDQSATSPPRRSIRCEPGWWTLIALHRSFRPCPGTWHRTSGSDPGQTPVFRTARASGPSCDFLDLGPRLDGVGELPLEQAVLVDLAVDRARRDQLVVRPARGDAALVEDDDLVRERDRREPVRDDQRRPPAHRLAQPDADQRLRR